MRKVLLSYLLFFGGIVQGQQNYCLDFDGDNDYVTLGSLPNASAFTIEFWIKLEGTQPGTNFTNPNDWWEGRGIIDNEINGYRNDDWGISLFNNNVIAFGVGGSSLERTITSPPLSYNTWYHVAATYSTYPIMRLYIDGIQRAGTNSCSVGLRDMFQIRLGGIKTGINYGCTTGCNAFFKGQIDELRIWDHERSATDILADMNKQINGNRTGLIASYHFNQGSTNGSNSSQTTLSVDPAFSSTYNGTLSGFALTGTASNFVLTTGLTLPVTWQSFTAEKQGDVSVLKWSTASEQNTKDFEVQHSTNTLSWTPLGTVAAAGNSTTTQQYSFTHATPFKGNMYNYYRIMQRDLDGKFSYSKIASLIYDEPGPDVYVYPNPAIGIVTIYLAESQDVRLIDIAGATVWKGTLAAGRSQIPLTHLSKGIYWVVTENAKKQLLIQ